MPPAIRIDDLTKDYAVGFWRKRPYRALDRLSLAIEPGEVFGFLGPNGAGKTTTLKLLMQLIFPTSGRAEILGQPVGHVATRQRIGYLPENPYFYDYLTAEELLEYFAQLFGYEPPIARSAWPRCSTVSASGPSAGCSCASSRRAWCSASASPRRSSTIPRSSSSTSRCPVSIRSDAARSANLILQLRDQGRTVFFSSHILADAEALCSRVAVVAGGRLAAAGRLSDILAFEVRGWELVIADVTPEMLARLAHGGSPDNRNLRRALRGRAVARFSARAVLADLAAMGASRCRSIRFARRSKTSSSGAWRRPASRARRRRALVRAISRIAVSVFRESVRDRVLYNLVFFAVLLIASSYLLGQLTAGQDVKIIKDLGLAATAVFGLFIAIFIGIGLVSKEVERRSIYALLAKPISRPQFILGKYAGWC